MTTANTFTDPYVAPSHGHSERVARGTAFAVSVAAVTVLVGWAVQNPSLQSLFLTQVTVKANTAIGLLAAAGAILLLPSPRSSPLRIVARVLGAVVTLLGALTLAQYVFGVNLGIDEMIFRAPAYVGQTSTPGRMSAVTASCFAILGPALLLVDIRPWRDICPAQPLFVVNAAVALIALLGYAYGIIPTVGVGQGMQIAIPTAIALVLLSVGGLSIRPDTGWMRVLRSPDAGGMLARRLLPFAFLVPLLLGAFRMLGTWQNTFSPATLSAIVAVTTMLAFGMVMIRTASVLDVADRERQASERHRVTLVVEEKAARERAAAEHAAREIAEQAAREKAEALSVLDVVLNSAPTALALFDVQLRISRVNPAFEALTGLERNVHSKQDISRLLPGLASQIQPVLERVVSSGEPARNVELAGDPESNLRNRHWLASFYPVRRGSELMGVGAVMLETTERRGLELQLVQSQKMEAIGNLAGGVAHDFNNLLTVIKSYSEMALETLEPGALREDIGEIRDAANRAAALTGQLLAFSRKQMVQPRALDVNEVVTRVERMLCRLIGEDVDLVLALANDIGTVKADPGQVEQMIMNLAVNARDAMPNGGKLTIQTGNVRLADDDVQRRIGVPPGSYVMLAVSDSGSGMSPETVRRAFEPFFTTKPAGKGTGLGLATVYGIVKQAGGDIGIYSELGHGTSFKIYFPLVPMAAVPIAAPADGPPPRGDETILLIEDDDAVRGVAARMLTRAGYDVLEASKVTEALNIVRNNGHQIALVLTDMVMPEMSGSEVAREVLAMRPSARVLFMSGYTEDTVMRHRILDRDAAFIEKPFTPEGLMRKVREVLDRT